MQWPIWWHSLYARRRNTCRNHVEWSENTSLFFANGKTWRTCAGPIVESHFSTVSKYLMDIPSPLFWCVWVVVNNLPIVKAGVIPGPKYPRQGASEQVSRETYASCSGGASTSGTAAQPMPSSSQSVYSQTRTCPHWPEAGVDHFFIESSHWNLIELFCPNMHCPKNNALLSSEICQEWWDTYWFELWMTFWSSVLRPDGTSWIEWIECHRIHSLVS